MGLWSGGVGGAGEGADCCLDVELSACYLLSNRAAFVAGGRPALVQVCTCSVLVISPDR